MEAYREEMSPEMMGHAEASFNEDPNAVIYRKLRRHFDGKIVRKDLTKKIKEGANVPVYVLEFLLGQYCSSDNYADWYLYGNTSFWISQCKWN